MLNKDFCSALGQHPDDYIILLVDSEAAVANMPWQHLKTQQGDNWEQPEGAESDQAHLMVQVMELWFLADRQTVSAYYGQGFLMNSLPRQAKIEKIEKDKDREPRSRVRSASFDKAGSRQKSAQDMSPQDTGLGLVVETVSSAGYRPPLVSEIVGDPQHLARAGLRLDRNTDKAYRDLHRAFHFNSLVNDFQL